MRTDVHDQLAPAAIVNAFLRVRGILQLSEFLVQTVVEEVGHEGQGGGTSA